MIVVVGGHARKIGKTAVVSGLISVLKDYRWTAVKITHHPHGIPERCSIEQATAPGTGDSGRYLAAGAFRSFWIRAAAIEDALPALADILVPGCNAILESNRILTLVEPDLCLFVFDPSMTEFKDSALVAFKRADALIVTGEGPVPKGKQSFRVFTPQFTTEEIAEFVRGRAGLSGSL